MLTYETEDALARYIDDILFIQKKEVRQEWSKETGSEMGLYNLHVTFLVKFIALLRTYLFSTLA